MSVARLLKSKSSDVVTIGPDATLGVAATLLIQHGIGGLPVVETGGRVVGFLAERDVVSAVVDSGRPIRERPVREVMRRPAPLCAVDDSIHVAMARMTRERLRHLVVVRDEQVVGVLSVGDLVKHRLEELETETGVLRDYVIAQRARM